MRISKKIKFIYASIINSLELLFSNKKYVKIYKQVFSIGYNCENAYRFCKKYRFVDSSLFSWANTKNIETLLFVLQDLDKLFLHKPKKVPYMWECEDTHILFHGKENPDMSINFQKYSEEDFKQYQDELVSRVAHLKEKFIEQLTNDKKTLIMYTYKTTNESKEEIEENILKLDLILEKLGKNNCDLLIILEQANYGEYNLGDKIFVRYVDSFSPHDNVTTRKYDKKSWKKIFKEFKADYKLKNNKSFKFDEE